MPTSEPPERNQQRLRLAAVTLKLCPAALPLIFVLGVLTGCVRTTSGPDSTIYLDGAVDAARLLIARSDDGLGGGIPDRFPDGEISASLGMGAAGHALFFAELFAATGDSTYARAATAASRTAIDVSAIGSSSYGLYSGLAGVASAVTLVSDVIDDRALRAEGRRLFRDLAAERDPLSTPGGWSDVYDIMNGRAGIGLALLQGYRVHEDLELLDAAVQAGDDLLEAGLPASEGALRWLRSASQPLDLPNFSQGTAGVGFFMTRLAEHTGERRFLDAAMAAVRYLDQIADTTDGMFLIPYEVPNDDYVTTYDIGWANGPPGTARLHFLLWELLDDEEMRDRAESAARTLSSTGLPGASTDPSVWAGPFRIDRRFGTSGAAMFLIEWGLETDNRRWTRLAEHIVLDILEKSIRLDEGACWRIPLYAFQGEGEAVFSGYFYGSAGLGLALLRQHYQAIGEEPSVRLPDETLPFLWASRRMNQVF